MGHLIENINQRFSEWLDKLSDKERKAITIFLVCFCAFLLISTLYLAASKIDTKSSNLKKSREYFAQINDLEHLFIVAKQKNDKLLKSIKNNDISLTSMIPAVGSKLGISVKGIEEVRKPIAKTNVVEVTVKLTLSKLSIDKLSALIEAIEESDTSGLVKVIRLKVSKQFDDSGYLDLQMTVATWKNA